MNELPQRKRNRLPGYDYRQNGAYFITICAKDRHEIFGEIIANLDTGSDIEDAYTGYLAACTIVQNYGDERARFLRIPTLIL